MSERNKRRGNLMKKIILFAVVIIIVLGIINYKKILQINYKTEYSEYVEKYSAEFNIDKWLIYSIIKAESNFDKGATSNKGASRTYATNG